MPDGQYSIQYDDMEGLDLGTIDVQKTLDVTIDDFAAEKYYRVLSRKAIVLEGVPGARSSSEVKGDRLPIGNRGRARAFLDKERFYQVIVLGTRESESDRAKPSSIRSRSHPAGSRRRTSHARGCRPRAG